MEKILDAEQWKRFSDQHKQTWRNKENTCANRRCLYLGRHVQDQPLHMPEIILPQRQPATPQTNIHWETPHRQDGQGVHGGLEEQNRKVPCLCVSKSSQGGLVLKKPQMEKREEA